MRYLKSKKGQGAVEYALAVLIVVALLVVLFGSNNPLKTSILNAFSKVDTKVSGFNPTG